MRLWSLHPKYLDCRGLGALWREGLLANKCLVYLKLGKKMGYQNHGQLVRFKEVPCSISNIARYLLHVYLEASNRGYNYNAEKVPLHEKHTLMPVTQGQLAYEFQWLLQKLKVRDPERYEKLKSTKPNEIETHPLFRIVDGDIEEWEAVK
jgi:hypothetical protein